MRINKVNKLIEQAVRAAFEDGFFVGQEMDVRTVRTGWRTSMSKAELSKVLESVKSEIAKIRLIED
jgi:hypothetical protein